MAYNTRRGGAGGYMTTAASVGQRRPNNNSHQQQQQQQQLANNFVAGGQLTQPIKPLLQMPNQQPPPQRQQQPPQQKPHPQMVQRQQLQQQNLRQQAQQFLAQQQPHPLMQQQVQPPQQQPPASQSQLLVDQPKMEVTSEDKPVGMAQGVATDNTNGNDIGGGGDSEDGSERRSKRNKPFWMRKDGKINKKERLRRRNQRLRKILQPKNALMVLNELIGSAPYNMTENADAYEGTIFKCTVLVDGLEHVGVGKSKPSAKTAAAEAALKHMVLSKLKTTQSFEPSSVPVAPPVNAAVSSPVVDTSGPMEGGDIKMEIDGEDNLGGISWSHVACYALHKLLSSWDEGSNLAEKLARVAGSGSSSVSISEVLEKNSTNESFNPLLQLAQATSSGSVTTSDKTKTFEKRPAKKLPDAAATMNPIMLLNQMHPNAVYEEISKSGHTPLVQFTVKCTVNDEPFVGRGSTKKGARKMCAFAACRKVLGIQYDPAFLEQHGFSEDAVAFGSGAAASVAPPTSSIE